MSKQGMPRDALRRMLSGQRRVTTLAATAIFLSVAIGTGFWLARGLDGQRAAPDATALAAWLQVKLPPDITNYVAHAEGFQDQRVYARFEMAAADVEPFAATNGLARDSSLVIDNQLVRDWWKPNGAAALRGAAVYTLSSSRAGALMREARLLIAPIGGGRSVVYLIAIDF